MDWHEACWCLALVYGYLALTFDPVLFVLVDLGVMVAMIRHGRRTGFRRRRLVVFRGFTRIFFLIVDENKRRRAIEAIWRSDENGRRNNEIGVE